MVTIDKLAFIHLLDHQILMTQSRGQSTYYIPGGKREQGESDSQALIREVQEELAVALDPSSLTHMGTFTAQAHGKPTGVLVRMTCYSGSFAGTIRPSHEIQNLAYYTYAQRAIVGPVDQLIFDDLHAKGHLE